MKKGYRFEIAPSEEQKVFLEKSFGCARLVWNTVLDQTIKQYEAHKENSELPKQQAGGAILRAPRGKSLPQKMLRMGLFPGALALV